VAPPLRRLLRAVPSRRPEPNARAGVPSGGFGTFLLLGHDWASPDRTLNSYRLFAREVIPHFAGQLAAPRTSHDWATGKRDELFGRAGQAMLNAITSHVEEKAATAEGGSR
jgi:limonene 1,2-monooxygenase